MTENSVRINWVSTTRNALALAGFVSVMSILTQVTQAKLNSYKSEESSGPVSTAAERTAQLECLTQNIYFESGHESFEGKAAVGQVTMNRVESGKFGKGVCGVIYQKNIVYEKVICQFSWACDTKSHIPPIHSTDYAESAVVAKKVLLEGFKLPSLEKALFYHAAYINPGWKNKRIAQIGQHIFYE